MKNKQLRILTAMILFMVISCDEPETLVTNYIHRDGSITRKIEMRNIKKSFNPPDLQVPFDSTWKVIDSLEINDNGDTTWVVRAVKTFPDIDEINKTYLNDSGANRDVSRKVSFRKSFKWFNTEFRFSEYIDKELEFGYPISDFLDEEELLYFYSPQNLQDEQNNGPDSLKYRSLKDTISYKTDKWILKSIFSEWIGLFARLTGMESTDRIIAQLKDRENELVEMAEEKFIENFDSLWQSGIVLREFLGEENAISYRADADSALDQATENFFRSFNNYSVRIVMPGKLTGTNGFIDSSKTLLWPVQSDYFLTQPYEMWSESKVVNIWAWVVSGLFVIFVLTGVIFRIISKG